VDRKHFFILGNLDVPVRDSHRFIRWSVWTTLSEASFRRASELWEVAGRESEPPYFGWLGNQLPGCSDTLSIRTVVHTRPAGTRPRIEVIEARDLFLGDRLSGEDVLPGFDASVAELLKD
jgi:hypothetical protein